AGLLALDPMPAGSRDELFAAWRTLFDRIAEHGPTVLVFEDIQWADEGMLDFIEELLDRVRNKPIYVLTLARPELHEHRPSWGANVRSVTAMKLDPLEPEQMAEMVRRTVPGIPEDAVMAISSRAEGIPLYAVETIRMLLDRDEIVATGDGSYGMKGRADNLAVPDTLHALIAARLDALGEVDRRVVQTAAVVGQSFTIDALAAISAERPDALREQLTALVRRQILQVDVDPRSPERGQYQFVQAVVREVAEGSLSRADRRALHVAAARYYESLGEDELAGVLASHYVEAYRATPAGREADALAAQARVSLRGAAERALSLHSYKQGLAYLEQALAVTSEREEMVALHERAVSAAAFVGLFDAAMKHARAVETLSRDAGDRLGLLRGLTAQASTHMGEHAERPAITLLRPALEAAKDLGATPEVVAAQAELGRALMIGGEPEEAITWCDRVLATPDAATDEQLTEVLITKGTALTNTTRVREGEVLLRGAMYVAEQRGYISAALRARNNLLGLIGSDDVAAAAEVLTEGYSIAERHGMLTWTYQFAHAALSQSFELGAWDAWIDVVDELDAPGFYGAWRTIQRAICLAFRGRLDDAYAGAAEARALAGTSSSQAVASLAGSEATIHLAAGDWDAVMPSARSGWEHVESVDDSVLAAVVAAVAANEISWAREAVHSLAGIPRPGRAADGRRASHACALAMLEGRWSDARDSYLAARRDLTGASAAFVLALLNVSVGARAAGQFPEASEAATSAEQFFQQVGAQAFVERYRAAFVPATIGVTREKSANSPAGIPTS
ncbi:MAG: hypothetical protein QFC55_03285, partial [Chloroflexota bacterium]|nr:hypothetical protein [Chloroflexota bacterium]